jgi:hypothetical protein
MKIKITKDLLKEMTSTTGIGARGTDDGPNIFFSDFKTYKEYVDWLAKSLGYKIVDYLATKGEVPSHEYKPMGNQGSERLEINWKRKKAISSKLGHKAVNECLRKYLRNEILKCIQEDEGDK